jgi:hypothetical protein
MSGLPEPDTSASAGADRNASPWSGCVYCGRLAPVSGVQASIAERTRTPRLGVSTTPVTTSVVAEPAWTAVNVPAGPSLPIEAVVVKWTRAEAGFTTGLPLSGGIVSKNEITGNYLVKCHLPRNTEAYV